MARFIRGYWKIEEMAKFIGGYGNGRDVVALHRGEVRQTHRERDLERV